MSSTNVAEIYVIGNSSCHYNNLKTNIRQEFDPEKDSEVLDYIEFIMNTSIRNKTFPILLISAHGNVINGEYILKIIGKNELVLKASIISDKLKECKARGLRCIGLIEACHSGNFDVSGFEMAITASSSENVASYGIIQQSLDELLKNTFFTCHEIYKLLTDKDSYVNKVRSAWSSYVEPSCQLTGKDTNLQLIHPSSFKEIRNLKLRGTTLEFTNQLNKNKKTIGDYDVNQVYSMMCALYGKPVE